MTETQEKMLRELDKVIKTVIANDLVGLVIIGMPVRSMDEDPDPTIFSACVLDNVTAEVFYEAIAHVAAKYAGGFKPA